MQLPASIGPLPRGTKNSVFQKLGALNNEPVLPSTSYLPATPSVVPASSYVPSSETPPGEQAAGAPCIGSPAWAACRAQTSQGRAPAPT